MRRERPAGSAKLLIFANASGSRLPEAVALKLVAVC